jgi:AcrR family transcriptional regulator
VQRVVSTGPPLVGRKPGVNEADPRVRRTRQLLQDALVALLTEKSFDAITVQEITARATVNRATFYAHFEDKHDLFARFTRDWFRRALDARLPSGASFSRDNLRLLVLVTMDALAEMNDHCRPTEALQPLIMSAVQEELSTLLRDLLTTVPGRGVAIETAAAGVSWAIFGAALGWSQATPRPPVAATAAAIAALLMEGLSAVVDPEST